MVGIFTIGFWWNYSCQRKSIVYPAMVLLHVSNYRSWFGFTITRFSLQTNSCVFSQQSWTGQYFCDIEFESTSKLIFCCQFGIVISTFLVTRSRNWFIVKNVKWQIISYLNKKINKCFNYVTFCVGYTTVKSIIQNHVLFSCVACKS